MKQLENKVNKYINETLLTLNDLPEDRIPEDKMAAGIVERLFLRKYRKYAISQEVKTNVSNKINNIVENSMPIVFIPSFGGYKHWWSPTYPAIDWAEVFNMKFMLQYLAPIYNSYKKASVSIEYESEEVILSELNNVPQEGLDKYTETFRKLAAYFTEKLSGKTTIELKLARDLYNVDALLKNIEIHFDEYAERFDSYDEEDKCKRIHKVETNFLLNGVRDYTGLSDEEKYQLYRKSRILNETFLDMDFELRPDYFEGDTKIPLLFSFGLGPGGEAWLHIGSCSTSMVDFWAGIGILEYWPADDKFVHRILSRSQFESLKDSLTEVKVDSPISEITDNFKSIYVHIGKLNFGG